MTKLDRLPPEMLILICDSRKALLLRNSGSAIRPKLDVLDHLEDGGEANEMSDRPGRRYDGGAGSAPFRPKSAMEMPDLARQSAIAFAEKLIDHLERLQKSEPVDEMLIAAPPAFLGILRERMPPGLAQLVTAEVPKHLTEARVDEIADALVERW